MSRDVQHPDQKSIDNILKSLTNRPNVQSTLILSRKDGTIIRATGLLQPDSRANGPRLDYVKPQPTGPPLATPTAETNAKVDGEHESQNDSPSPAQHLAGTIYEFVKASSVLAVSISQSSSQGQPTSGEAASNANTQPPDTQLASDQDNDVQLVRMRTKTQEVIIFPDPNYLCCVVQDVARAAGRAESI